jgi:large subunit ribosomal protein L30
MVAKKTAKAGSKIKLRRLGSPIRRGAAQRATLIGLGLRRANQVVELEDTPAIQGMIKRVHHLIEIVE